MKTEIKKTKKENKMKVYHGTNKKFTKFENHEFYFFAENSNISDQFGHVMECEISPKNVLDNIVTNNDEIWAAIQENLYSDDSEEILVNYDGEHESLSELMEWGNLIFSGRDIQTEVLREVRGLGYDAIRMVDFHGGNENENVIVLFNNDIEMITWLTEDIDLELENHEIAV